MNELEVKLNNIQKIFNIQEILNIKSDDSYIQKYYLINKLSYTFFHNKDYIHFGLSRNGIYKDEDLLESVKIIEQQIIEQNAPAVLELATGRGSNSIYLAKKFPKAQFYGIDISNGQLEYAYKKAEKINNYHPSKDNYHNLENFQTSSFDVVFVIEGLCYSESKNKVLAEVHRVLKSHGLFIIIDGYRNKEDEYSANELLGVKLIEKGMAFNPLQTYDSFKDDISLSDFKISKDENASLYVIPTLDKFERSANKYFKHPLLAKLLARILPKEFLYNSLSGYLLSYFVKKKLMVYMITVLQK